MWLPCCKKVEAGQFGQAADTNPFVYKQIIQFQSVFNLILFDNSLQISEKS
jgi:hypothetical protein